MKTPDINLSQALILCLLLISGGYILAATPAETDRANKAYMAGFYENAAQLYEKILDEGKVAPEAYYNLGNAYFKMNQIPKAILNYERALKYQPGDEDIIYNLNIANARLVDKIDVLPELFYIRWWKSLRQWLSPDQWAISLILLFTFVFIFAALFLLSRNVNLRKSFFAFSLIFLMLTFLSAALAYQSYNQSVDQKTAIVMAPTLPVKSSPDESSIDLFVIHEGLKVTLLDKIGTWTEIRIANGNIGWVKQSDIQPI